MDLDRIFKVYLTEDDSKMLRFTKAWTLSDPLYWDDIWSGQLVILLAVFFNA